MGKSFDQYEIRKTFGYVDREIKSIKASFLKITEDDPATFKAIYENSAPLQYGPEATNKLKVAKTNSKSELNQTVYWGLVPSLFGGLLIAKTSHGLCGMAFSTRYGLTKTLDKLTYRWGGKLIKDQNNIMKLALKIFSGNDEIPIHLLGTMKQVKVWKYLIKLPYSRIMSYSEVAKNVHLPNAVRAVSSAIGANPISWLIPCHRVLSKDFYLSGYNWGLSQKSFLLSHEFELSSKRLFELQFCCLKLSCELNKDDL